MLGMAMKRPKKMSAKQMTQHQTMRAYYQQVAQNAQTQQALINAMTQGNTWVTSSTSPTLGSLFVNGAGTYTTATSGTTATTISSMSGTGGVGFPPAAVFDDPNTPPHYVIGDGRPIALWLPDGTVIDVKADGSFTINDKDAKVTYRANRVRDFNSYINASDKLEEFIRYCGEQGVRQSEMLDLPVKLFIGWLILQAAMADGENPDPVALLDEVRDHVRPRCRCGRFLSKKLTARKIAFCRPICLERELAEDGPANRHAA